MSACESLQVFAPRRGLDRLRTAAAQGTVEGSDSMSFGSASTTGPGRPLVAV